MTSQTLLSNRTYPPQRVPGVIFDPILGPSFEGYMAKTPKVAPLNMGPPAKRGSKKVTILGHIWTPQRVPGGQI
jgi:hypothetical protein